MSVPCQKLVSTVTGSVCSWTTVAVSPVPITVKTSSIMDSFDVRRRIRGDSPLLFVDESATVALCQDSNVDIGISDLDAEVSVGCEDNAQEGVWDRTCRNHPLM